jgi:hypothetical protein
MQYLNAAAGIVHFLPTCAGVVGLAAASALDVAVCWLSFTTCTMDLLETVFGAMTLSLFVCDFQCYLNRRECAACPERVGACSCPVLAVSMRANEQQAQRLHDRILPSNPAGCRLGISFPGQHRRFPLRLTAPDMR